MIGFIAGKTELNLASHKTNIAIGIAACNLPCHSVA